MEEGPSECSLLISLQTQPRCPFLSTKCWKDTAESPDGLAGGSSKPTAAYLGKKGAGGKHSQVLWAGSRAQTLLLERILPSKGEHKNRAGFPTDCLCIEGLGGGGEGF